MSRIERSITIEVVPAVVWSTVSELDKVTRWNPTVSRAICGPITRGVGATRTCEIESGAKLVEVVAEWIEGEAIWFALDPQGGIRSADMGLRLTADPASELRTIVTFIADYHLSFGPLGPVIDRLTVKRSMARMLDDSLAGLKQHLEP